MIKKAILLCLLALISFSLSVEANVHEQQRAATTTNQNLKPGFWPTKGDPFGQNTGNTATCFQAPCYEPPATACKGKWSLVVFKVHTSIGQPARFVGYQCK